MFIIGGNQDVCPRGFICINNYNLLIILIIIVVGIYLLNKQVYLSLYNKMLLKKMNNEEVNSEDINEKNVSIYAVLFILFIFSDVFAL